MQWPRLAFLVVWAMGMNGWAQPALESEAVAALNAQLKAAEAAQAAADRPAAEQALNKAAALLREMSQDDPARATGLARITQCYNTLGYSLRAETLWQEQVAANASNPALLEAALAGLAGQYQGQQQYRKSVAVLQQLIAVQEKRYGSGHGALKPGLQNLAYWYERMGELRQAEAALQRAEGLPEATDSPGAAGLLGESPVRRGSFLMMQSTRGTLADFYARHYRMVDAERLYRATLARADLPLPVRRTALSSLARLLEQQRRFADAIDVQQQVMREAETSGDANLAAGSRQVIARILLSSGDAEQADKMYQEELQRTSSLTGVRRQEYGAALISYSLALTGQKRYDEAAQILKQYLGEAQAQTGSGFSVSAGYNLLANVEHQRGNREAAEAWRSQDPNVRAREPIPPAELLAVNQATQAVYAGKADDVANQTQQLLASLTAQGPKAAGQLTNVAHLASAMAQRGQKAQGEDFLNRAVALMEQWQGADSTQALMMRLDYCQQACPEQALVLIEQGRARDLALHGPQHPSELMWINRRITLLREMKRTAEQEEAFQEAIRLNDAIYGARSPESIGQWRAWASELAYRQGAAAPQVEQAWRGVLQLIDEGDGAQSLQYATALVSYAQALARLKQPDRAVTMLEQAIRTMKETPGTDPQVRNLEDGLKMIQKQSSGGRLQ